MDDIDRHDWAAYCHGQSAALARIHQRHSRKLLNYCAYVLGDHGAAQEVVQETFLRLLAQNGQFAIESRLQDWLFICARNLCFGRLRAAKTQARLQELIAPPASAIDAETKRFIEVVLGRLEPEERDLILLRELQQFSIDEIATMLAISAEAVRVRLHRIRKKMQKLGES